MAEIKRYDRYDLSDFLKDEMFVKWVKSGDQYSNKFWRNWMDSHPDKVKTVLKAKEIIESMAYSNEYKLSQDRVSRLFEDILKDRKKKSGNRTRILLKAAASVALLFLSYFLFDFFENSAKDVLAEKAKLVSFVRSTPAGQKLTFELPDKSVVKLNSSSTIRYWESPEDSSRNVYLSGEAYFDVYEDPSRPFVVSTNEFITTALGTEFDIKAYLGDSKQKYSLISGSIEVASKFSNSDQSVTKILVPNEQLVYDRSSREVSLEIFDTSTVLAWKNDILLFKEKNLTEVFRTLELWYGVEILILNDIGKMDRVFSGTFRNESLENVLKVIGYSVKFDFTIEKNKAFVEFKDHLKTKESK